MHRYTDSPITIVILGLFFVAVFGYGCFEARGMIMGPRVSVATQTASVHDPLVTIQGHADRIKSLTLNGTPVSVTEDGAFNQQYLLSPGENNLILEASDVYGHSTDKTLSMTYQPLTIVATSTSFTAATATSTATSTKTSASSTNLQ
jgi:hypothetical protein